MKVKLELTDEAYRQMNKQQYKAARSYLRKVEKQLSSLHNLEDKIEAGLCDLMSYGTAVMRLP